MRRFLIFSIMIFVALIMNAQNQEDLLKDSPIKLPFTNGSFKFEIADNATVDKKMLIAKLALTLAARSEEKPLIYINKPNHILNLHYISKKEQKYYKNAKGAVWYFEDQFFCDVEVKCLKDKFSIVFSQPYNIISFNMPDLEYGGGTRVFISSDRDLKKYTQEGQCPFFIENDKSRPFPFERELEFMKLNFHFTYDVILKYMNEEMYENCKKIGWE